MQLVRRLMALPTFEVPQGNFQVYNDRCSLLRTACLTYPKLFLSNGHDTRLWTCTRT